MGAPVLLGPDWWQRTYINLFLAVRMTVQWRSAIKPINWKCTDSYRDGNDTVLIYNQGQSTNLCSCMDLLWKGTTFWHLLSVLPATISPGCTGPPCHHPKDKNKERNPDGSLLEPLLCQHILVYGPLFQQCHMSSLPGYLALPYLFSYHLGTCHELYMGSALHSSFSVFSNGDATTPDHH